MTHDAAFHIRSANAVTGNAGSSESTYKSTPLSFVFHHSSILLSLKFKMSKAYVELQVKENKVVVFSKTYCPFCKKAKEALSSTGLKDYALIELDERDDGDEIQDILKGITGGRSVGIIQRFTLAFVPRKQVTHFI